MPNHFVALIITLCVVVVLLLLSQHSTDHFASFTQCNETGNGLQSQANTYFHYVPPSCNDFASNKCDNIDCYNAVKLKCLNATS